MFGLQIINLWQNTDFHLSPHQGRDTFIIAGADDIMAQLEESQVTIGTIKASRYIAPIQVQIVLSFSQIYQSTFKSDSSFLLNQYYLIKEKTCLMVDMFTWYKKKNEWFIVLSDTSWPMGEQARSVFKDFGWVAHSAKNVSVFRTNFQCSRYPKVMVLYDWHWNIAQALFKLKLRHYMFKYNGEIVLW